MMKSKYSRLHKRLKGLTKVIKKMIKEAEAASSLISGKECDDLKFIYSRLQWMLADDRKDTARSKVKRDEGEQSFSERYSLNTGCDFFDLDANRAQCAVGGDLYHCGRNCLYATNVPGTLPPYGTKYMRGGHL